ncbi:MAG: DciA family protein [Burkholderiales bacterium]
MSLRRIACCLDTKDRSHAAIQHARYLMELQRVFLEAAPSSLKTHASVGSCKNGTLVLLTHNGAVATKLQQTAPTLLTAYQKCGFEVTKIRFAVQVGTYASPHFKRARLSRKAAKAVGDLALELQDPELKSVLIKLASRASD